MRIFTHECFLLVALFLWVPMESNWVKFIFGFLGFSTVLLQALKAPGLTGLKGIQAFKPPRHQCLPGLKVLHASKAFQTYRPPKPPCLWGFKASNTSKPPGLKDGLHVFRPPRHPDLPNRHPSWKPFSNHQAFLFRPSTYPTICAA